MKSVSAQHLDALERWMQSAIELPNGPRAATAEVERHVLPSRELSAVERLSIYSTMVRQRLVEVLGQEFPALRHALGEERWESLAATYLERHPSAHPNLNRLGAKLAAFVRDEAPAEIVREPRAFLAELATLERTIQDVFDAPACDALLAADLLALPRERWPALVLETIPAFALLAFEHPVNAWYQSWREDRAPPIPSAHATHVAVYRKDFVVWRANLELERYTLLEALARGATLGEALDQCASLPGADLSHLAGSLAGWFQEWAAEGLFRART